MSLLLWREDIVEDCRGEKYTLKYIQFKIHQTTSLLGISEFLCNRAKTDSNGSKVFKGICEILLEIKEKLIRFQGLHYIWH